MNRTGGQDAGDRADRGVSPCNRARRCVAYGQCGCENPKIKAAGFLAWAILCSALATPISGCGSKHDAVNPVETRRDAKGGAAPRIAETKAIAEEGFIYGLPLVMNYAVMYQFAVDTKSSQFKAPFNEIANAHRLATYEDTAVVTPNSDTPYSWIWLDLRAEPMVISVPAVAKERYYSVQLIDGNTYNFGYIGSRATGSEPGDYLVVGPDWKGSPPAGIKKVFSSMTPFVLGIFRTQIFGTDDMPNVKKVQAGYKAQPLSAYLKQPAPPPAPKIDFLPATTDGIKAHFYEYLAFALQFVPPSPEDKDIRAKLARIGVGPGKTPGFKELSPAHKTAIMLGMDEAADKVDKYIAAAVKNINGWYVGSPFGDRAFYKGDWLMRAGAAKHGI